MLATANSQAVERKEPPRFSSLQTHSIRASIVTRRSRAPFATVTKKKEQTVFANVCEQSTSEMWPRRTRLEERSGEERREGEKIEMLISHCVEGGNYVLMRSRLAKSPGKRDTRPDHRTRKRVSRFSLFFSLTNQPPWVLTIYARVRVFLHNVIR